jgi:hypothetical protein
MSGMMYERGQLLDEIISPESKVKQKKHKSKLRQHVRSNEQQSKYKKQNLYS